MGLPPSSSLGSLTGNVAGRATPSCARSTGGVVAPVGAENVQPPWRAVNGYFSGHAAAEPMEIESQGHWGYRERAHSPSRPLTHPGPPRCADILPERYQPGAIAWELPTQKPMALRSSDSRSSRST